MIVTLDALDDSRKMDDITSCPSSIYVGQMLDYIIIWLADVEDGQEEIELIEETNAGSDCS